MDQSAFNIENIKTVKQAIESIELNYIDNVYTYFIKDRH